MRKNHKKKTENNTPHYYHIKTHLKFFFFFNFPRFSQFATFHHGDYDTYCDLQRVNTLKRPNFASTGWYKVMTCMNKLMNQPIHITTNKIKHDVTCWTLRSNGRTKKTSYKIVYSEATILITLQHYYKFTGGRAIVAAHPPLDHRWFNGRRGISRPPIPLAQKCRNNRFVWRHGKSSGFSRSIEECSQGKNTTFTLETYSSYAKYTLSICKMCI